MIITKLAVENFKLFKGKHVFDFRPKKVNGHGQPIILIGGKNGAGKTTIFEAVKICLYGKRLSLFRWKKGEYDRFISASFHRVLGSSLQLDTASVALEFEYSNLGKTDIFSVKRAWKRKNKKVYETLDVTKNGIQLSDLEASQWQEFIDELVPQGISQLFFFDGEEIQALATANEDNVHLKDSFKALLGLNIIEQLQADLSIHLARQARLTEDNEIKETLAKLKLEEQNFEELLDNRYQSIAQKRAVLSHTDGQIERIETRIASEGGSFANERSEQKLASRELGHEIEAKEVALREFCANLLPFAITPKYCRMVKARLSEEQTYREYTSAKHLLETALDGIRERIDAGAIWRRAGGSAEELTDELKADLANELIAALSDSLVQTDKYRDFISVHNFSPVDERKILSWIDAALAQVPSELTADVLRLEQLIRERHKIETRLDRAPEDDVLNPMMQQLAQLHQEVGKLNEQIQKDEKSISQLEYGRTECQRKLSKEFDALTKIDKHSKQITLANHVQSALADYAQALQKEKTEQLSRVFEECLTQLLRKVGMIKHVEISADDFSIALFDRGGAAISQSELSVGEKQMFAISMLWALTIVSGRPLPFIIDTPLGRLDSDHRKNLVTGFFPKASHQMIVLSTDTEINKQYFETLAPYVARSYHLKYDVDEGATRIDKDYFWHKMERVPT